MLFFITGEFLRVGHDVQAILTQSVVLLPWTRTDILLFVTLPRGHFGHFAVAVFEARADAGDYVLLTLLYKTLLKIIFIINMFQRIIIAGSQFSTTFEIIIVVTALFYRRHYFELAYISIIRSIYYPRSNLRCYLKL